MEKQPPPYLIIHGVRGGGHAPDHDPDNTYKYGTLTCCAELRDLQDNIPTHTIFDAGTGIANIIDDLQDKARINLFFTHLHEDHTSGFRQFMESLAYLPFRKAAKGNNSPTKSRFLDSIQAAYKKWRAQYEVNIFSPLVQESVRINTLKGNRLARLPDYKPMTTLTKGKYVLESLCAPPFSDGIVPLDHPKLEDLEDHGDFGADIIKALRGMSLRRHTLYPPTEAARFGKPLEYSLGSSTTLKYMEGFHPAQGESLVFRVDGMYEKPFSFALVTDVSLENSRFREDLKTFIAGVDVVLFDCYFTAKELKVLRFGRYLPRTSHQITHPCCEDVIELCGKKGAGIPLIIATHFPDYRNDEDIDHMIHSLEPLARANATRFVGGYPGLRFDLLAKKLVHTKRQHRRNRSVADQILEQLQNVPDQLLPARFKETIGKLAG